MADRNEDGERNAGAFMAPGGLIGVPMHTLSDEIPREPDELEAERPPRHRRRGRSLRERLARALGREREDVDVR